MKQYFMRGRITDAGVTSAAGHPECYRFRASVVLTGLLLWSHWTAAVENGVYHCNPAHSAHYLQLEDGEATELFLNNENALIIITIDKDTVHLQDSRVVDGKTIDITDNVTDGPVIGQTGSRQFYMNSVLHYFYGAVDEGGVAAYAEDGRCRKY